MKSSPEGLVPARGFLNAGMKPRPSFNDGSSPGENIFPFTLSRSGIFQPVLRSQYRFLTSQKSVRLVLEILWSAVETR